MLCAYIAICLFFYLFHHVASLPPRQQRPIEELFERLMFDYIREVRPVKHPGDVLNVSFGASLIQLIDVDEKNQIVTTNLWLDMVWFDQRLKWQPLLYDNITRIHIPSEKIWVPDVVLDNNAAGNPQITFQTDVMVDYAGRVEWKPPAIYKSFCSVDVTWFPYDKQDCNMKFILWTHSGQYVDLHFHPHQKTNSSEKKGGQRPIVTADPGMDLSYFYVSAEWDILLNTAARHEKIYPGCCGYDVYVDITFRFVLRRRTLFYTVNLILPCVLISFLTVFVFYLPSGSRQKIVLCISILVTLSVFFLLLFDIMPATSLNTPMIGKYLLFDMVLCSASIAVTIMTLNLHYHRGDREDDQMKPWVRWLFLEVFAKWVSVERPNVVLADENRNQVKKLMYGMNWQNPTAEEERPAPIPSPLPVIASMRGRTRSPVRNYQDSRSMRQSQNSRDSLLQSHTILRLLNNVQYIADHYRHKARVEEIAREWSHLALVIDRICLWLFSIATLLGTGVIILSAPTLYEDSKPLEQPVPTKPLGYANM